jgi:hypothetical protein
MLSRDVAHTRVDHSSNMTGNSWITTTGYRQMNSFAIVDPEFTDTSSWDVIIRVLEESICGEYKAVEPAGRPRGK